MTPRTQLGRPSTGLPRYFMDCGWYRHPRFVGLAPDVLFVVSAAVGYCTQHALDGDLPADPEDLALALGVRASLIKKALPQLVERHIFERMGDLVHIRNWEEHNPTSKEIKAKTAERREAGRRGNHVRWHEQEGVVDEDCNYCVASL